MLYVVFRDLLFSLAIKIHPRLGGGQNLGNSSVRTYVNALIHKSNENAGTIVKINFFQILEINQRLTIISGAALPRKVLSLG